MKIAHITKTLTLGGGPRAIFYMCKAMPKEQFFLYAKRGIMEEDFKTLDNVELRFVDDWSFSTCRKIYRQCLAEHVEVMHFHSMFPAIMFWPFEKISRVLTFHGLHIRKYDYISQPIKRALRRWVKNEFVRRFDACIVLNESDRYYMTKLLYNNSYANKLYVVPNAVMLDEKRMSDMPKVDFEKDYLNLLVVARYDFQKGFDLLLDMLKKSDFALPVKVYFIGDEKVKEIVNKYRKAGVMCIEYIGSTNQPYAWMKAADYLLLPSRWEGLPMVVLEALKLGTKVIAADTANINDLADERNVWLYKQGDVEDFVDLVEICGRKKGMSVSADMEKYSLENVGALLKQVYFGHTDKKN